MSHSAVWLSVQKFSKAIQPFIVSISTGLSSHLSILFCVLSHQINTIRNVAVVWSVMGSNTAVSTKVPHKCIKKHTRQWRLALWIIIVWCSMIELDRISGRNNINTHVCADSFCYDEMPLALIKQPLATITHNTNWHCGKCFYPFVGQPFLKQLYSENSA